MKSITDRLFELQDPSYCEFQKKLIPDTKYEMIGVRTPDLRKLAKELSGTQQAEEFLKVLPHKYFDENQLHAFIISLTKDFDTCVSQVNAFLPYVDNWATCDQLSPKVFAKNKPKLVVSTGSWIKDRRTYTVRFGIGMLMQHYLDADFKEEYMETVASVKSEEYYIRMMIAWYFATALAKQYDSAVKYLENRKLDVWTHNKTIQKAVESYRITEGTKTYLKSLRLSSKVNS
jgi:3-methyladenine DNA glycosylase AlkD